MTSFSESEEEFDDYHYLNELQDNVVQQILNGALVEPPTRRLRGDEAHRNIEGTYEQGAEILAKSASAVSDGLSAMISAGTLPFKVLGRVVLPPFGAAAKPFYQPIAEAVGLPLMGTPEDTSAKLRQLEAVVVPVESLPKLADEELYAEALASVSGNEGFTEMLFPKYPQQSKPNFHDAVDQVAALEEAALLRSLSAVEDMAAPADVKQDVMAELVGEAVKRVLRCKGNDGDGMRFNYPYYIGHPFYSEKRGYWENPMIPHPFTKADLPDMPPVNGPRYANRADRKSVV